MMDRNLCVLGSTTLPLSQHPDKDLRWTCSAGELILFYAEGVRLWSSQFMLDRREFSPWVEQQTGYFRFKLLPCSSYLSTFFSVDMKTRYEWNAAARRFEERAVRGRRLPDPDDFNRDFATSVKEDVFVLHGIDDSTDTYLPRVRNYNFVIGKLYCDQYDQGTVWYVTEGKLVRFRLARKTPTLVELATDVYAKACFGLFDCEAWKARFAGAVDRLSAGLSARTWRTDGTVGRRWLLTHEY
jgi:hypothetical protein